MVPIFSTSLSRSSRIICYTEILRSFCVSLKMENKKRKDEEIKKNIKVEELLTAGVVKCYTRVSNISCLNDSNSCLYIYIFNRKKKHWRRFRWLLLTNARIDRFTHTSHRCVASEKFKILAKEEKECKHMLEFMIEVKR